MATQHMNGLSTDQMDQECKSSLVSRNITIGGRRTSVRLEPEMWTAIREISKREQCTMHEICTLISLRKDAKTSLTAAIRVFLMLYFRAATTEEGHRKAGHGNFEYMRQRAKLPSNALPFKRSKQGANVKPFISEQAANSRERMLYS